MVSSRTVLFCGLVLCLGAGILIWERNFLKASHRSPVSRVKLDQLFMARALEDYYADNNAYPPHTMISEQYVESPSLVRLKIPGPRAKFEDNDPANSTTTFSYITSFWSDPFAPDRGNGYAYYTVETSTSAGWIIWSPGPDAEYDLDWTLYNPDDPQPSPELLTFAYDSSNGSVSGGDIFRVKQ